MNYIDDNFWKRFYLDKNSIIKKMPSKILKLEEKLEKVDNKINKFDFDNFDEILWIRLINQFGSLVDQIYEEKLKLF